MWKQKETANFIVKRPLYPGGKIALKMLRVGCEHKVLGVQNSQGVQGGVGVEVHLVWAQAREGGVSSCGQREAQRRGGPWRWREEGSICGRSLKGIHLASCCFP